MSVKVKVKASSTIELDKSIVEKIEELAERSDLDPSSIVDMGIRLLYCFVYGDPPPSANTFIHGQDELLLQEIEDLRKRLG